MKLDAPIRWSYLLQETAAILLLGYLILFGGTLNGLVQFRLHVISHVIVAAVLVIWLGSALWKRRHLAATGLERIVVLVLGVMGVTALLSTDPRRSLGWLGFMLLYTLWFYLVYDLVKQGWPPEQLVKSLLIVTAIVIAWGVLEIGNWYLGWLRQSGGQLVPSQLLRLYSLLGDANMLSSLMNLALPLAVVAFFITTRRFARILLALWIAGDLLVQFFTSSRGGWLGTCVVFVTLGLLLGVIWARGRIGPRQGWQRLRQSRTLFIVPLVVVGLLILGAVAYVARYQLQHPSHSSIWVTRQDFWRAAWSMFQSSPLYGVGPSTYGTHMLEYVSVPPWRPFPHAHSLPMTVLAEGGMVGILALVVLCVAFVKVVRQSWRGATSAQRLLMAGGIASLAGFSVHSLVDNHVGVPALGTVMLGIAAMTLAIPTRDGARGGRRMHPAWVVAPALLLVGSMAWSDWAYQPFSDGVRLANEGRWTEAAPLVDLSAGRDSRLAFYPLQQGYVWGVLAAGTATDRAASTDQDNEVLRKAIQFYQRGVGIEPYYSLNHANLSALYWQAGARDQALAEMEQAVHLAPGETLYALNMARYAEEMGQTAVALKYYGDALSLRPQLAEARHFWARTSVRRAAVAGWDSEHPQTAPDHPTSFGDYWLVGWDAYRRGDWSLAEQCFLKACALSPDDLRPYQGLGLVYTAQQDYPRAESYLRRGMDLFTMNEGDKFDLLLAFSELAYRQGKMAEAVRRYEWTLGLAENPTVYGLGMRGWSPYGWFLFQRESIDLDVLPQLIWLPLTDDQATQLVSLAQAYEALGRIEESAKAYWRILALVPDFEPAVRGLTHLEGAGNK